MMVCRMNTHLPSPTCSPPHTLHPQDCVDRFGSRHQFLGFIDVDEFLVFHDPSLDNVNQLLRRWVL